MSVIRHSERAMRLQNKSRHFRGAVMPSGGRSGYDTAGRKVVTLSVRYSGPVKDVRFRASARTAKTAASVRCFRPIFMRRFET